MKNCENCAFYGGKCICKHMNPIKIPDSPSSHWCIFYESEQYRQEHVEKIPCKLSPDGEHLLIYRAYDKRRTLPVTSFYVSSTIPAFSQIRGSLRPSNGNAHYTVYSNKSYGTFAVKEVKA